MRPDFEQRFVNWLAWCAGRVMLPGIRAISAEAGWIGPQGKGCPTGWGDYDISSLPPKPPRIRVDAQDGLEVNRAYIQLPEQDRLAIKLTWFKQLRPQRAAQIIGCHHTKLHEIAHRAKDRLRELAQ